MPNIRSLLRAGTAGKSAAGAPAQTLAQQRVMLGFLSQYYGIPLKPVKPR